MAGGGEREGGRRKCQRERQEEAGETRDRILRRSIKSWRVQSFLRDDPGNGRAVALLIPLPAANFSPFPLSFFSLFPVILSKSASSPCPLLLSRSLCRLTPLFMPFLQPFLSGLLHNALRRCYPFPFPCFKTRRTPFVLSLRYARNAEHFYWLPYDAYNAY